MEVLNPISAGMDVHRDTVVVTILKSLPNGRTWKETRTFETFSDGLRLMVAWLDKHQVPIAAMESTGVLGPAVEKNVRRGRLHMRPLRRPAPGGGLRVQLRHRRPHPPPPPPPIPAASPGPRPGPTTTPAVRLTLRVAPNHPAAVLAPRRARRRLPSPPPSSTSGPLMPSMTRASAGVPPSAAPRSPPLASERAFLCP